MRKALLITLLVLLGAVNAMAGPADPPTLPALPEPGQVVGISRFSVADIQKLPNPGNPPTGLIRLYADSTTGNLTCLTPTGADCLSGGGGGGGTVTSIATTSPIGGGTITTTGTITCATCLTATTPTNHGVLLGAGTQAVGATAAPSTANEPFVSGASADPSYLPYAIPATIAAHQTLVATSTTVVAAKTVPDCTDTTGNHLNYTQSSDSYSCGTSVGSAVTSVATTGPITGGTITATGTIACATCVTSAAALTANQLVVGGGLQASAALGSLGTTTTVLHGNAGGLPSFGAVANADLTNSATTPNGQTCTLGSTCNVNVGATAHSVSLNQGNGSALTGVGPGTTGQFLRATSSADPTYSDFADVKFIPAANCNNATAGNGWSIGSGGTVTCRAGTNNLGGFVSITDTASTFATFQVEIPEDWDSSSNPFIRFQLASTDATNNHTIIPSIQVACYKGDGSTTDDVAANAAHSLSTTTLNGNANRFWSGSTIQMNSTDVTGCVAGALMQVTVGRATDTATNASFYGATITFPRLIVVQAN